EVLAAVLHRIDGGAPVLRGDDRPALGTEQAGARAAHRGIVVDDQDAPEVPSLPIPARRGHAPPAGCRARNRISSAARSFSSSHGLAKKRWTEPSLIARAATSISRLPVTRNRIMSGYMTRTCWRRSSPSLSASSEKSLTIA